LYFSPIPSELQPIHLHVITPIITGVQIMKLLVMYFSRSSCTSSPLGTNILFSTQHWPLFHWIKVCYMSPVITFLRLETIRQPSVRALSVLLLHALVTPIHIFIYRLLYSNPSVYELNSVLLNCS
jgi:hypothetical protein